MGPDGDSVRVCKRGHRDQYRADECLVCKKTRDDRHRLNARLAGKDAARQRAWYTNRYCTDPVFRARELERTREARRRPEVRLARQLGVGVAQARSLL